MSNFTQAIQYLNSGKKDEENLSSKKRAKFKHIEGISYPHIIFEEKDVKYFINSFLRELKKEYRLKNKNINVWEEIIDNLALPKFGKEILE